VIVLPDFRHPQVGCGAIDEVLRIDAYLVCNHVEAIGQFDDP
jgi:hypothetical protein